MALGVRRETEGHTRAAVKTASIVLSTMLSILIGFPGASVARAAGKPIVGLPPGCGAPLTLTLQPGLHFDGTDRQVPGFHPAPDAPAGPVSLQLPLYPGTVPTSHEFSGSLFSYPASLYLKSGTVAFLVPADEAAAEAWYRQSFAACGYAVMATQGPTDRGVGIWFRSTTNRDVTPWVVLEPNPSGGTFVLYVGEVIDLPPRPGDSYLPTDIVRVRLRYTLATTPDPPYEVERFTIRRHTLIHQLVSSINALTDVVGAGLVSCTWYGTTTLAGLQFVRQSGKTITVRVQPGCRVVIVGHTRPLLDFGSPVWNSVQQIAAECQERRC